MIGAEEERNLAKWRSWGRPEDPAAPPGPRVLEIGEDGGEGGEEKRWRQIGNGRCSMEWLRVWESRTRDGAIP